MLKLPNSEQSYWREVYQESLYPELANDLTVDVVIVGAGITGLTTAYLLKQFGLSVAVLDKHTVGGGTTGRTTGKITSQHNLFYQELQNRAGTDAARIYGEANQAAIDQIETTIATEKIACDWQRDDNYVFTNNLELIKQFQQEAKIAASLGLPATFETTTPLPFAVQGAVRFKNQAKFHSQKYLLGLAKAIHGNGSYVFENSTVVGISDGSPGRIKTKKAQITAQDIVVASSVPTFPLLARGGYGILEYPTESYIVAGRLNKKQSGMYISPDKHHYSILPISVGEERILLIGGEGHFYGLRGNRQARYQRLSDYAEKQFGITEITHRWSDRDYLAYDSVPLVGKLYPWSKHLYVGTGFKKWGLSNGTVAGMILSDLIVGNQNKWASTFSSNRLKPIMSIPHAALKMLKGK